ncbi:hypothetical protein CC78DRAFT_586824 [Lojkania enalia]|uniref:Camp independent regulatory protein n=1 Tax=Lojkania enalia TaxID=147567 RepID=A0A9P4MYM3_9PLEO|nr:hypothetical protein CC78DRAFT_586824 [Didymosphaeria enalia]
MLQGIRASTLTMPSFGHNLSFTGVQKMDGFGDLDPWNWPNQQPNASTQSFSNIFDPASYTGYTHSIPHGPGSVQPRHHSIAASRVVSSAQQAHSSTPPPRHQVAGGLVKAQPAFKPTWNGFLDTTKDAMTIVEAALQGRLSHISRRPHDKERAEMLTSGTVIVYEENASGIKRWTDAVHWSPSRVMNNCLIYRQLIRALKPEEKKAALNPSCGGKRKRKESASPSITNTGENINHVEDEYENSTFESGVPGEMTPATDPLGKVYANFAQTLTPDQQRRFCGSLIDSYEFKDGGLMKKTISVKYQGTHHHVISYYSLEDVVNGKLKRPFEDPKLADIQPRPELLTGWKVSLEDEEIKDMPVMASYSQPLHPSHVQHQPVAAVVQSMPSHGLAQNSGSLQLQMPSGYWQGSQGQPYNRSQHTPHYMPTQQATSQYAVSQPTSQYSHQPNEASHFSSQQPTAEQYSARQPTSQTYNPHHQPSAQYPSQSSSGQQFSSQQVSTPQYSSEQPPVAQFNVQPQPTPQYPEGISLAAAHQYSQQNANPHYTLQPHSQSSHQPQYAMAQAQVFDLPIHVPQNQHDPQRRASAPVPMQTYGQTHSQGQYQANMQPESYYISDQKYTPRSGYGF